MENRPEANCEVQFINGIKIVYNAEKKIIELKRNSNDHQPLKFEPNVTEIGMVSFMIVYRPICLDIDFISNFRLSKKICQRMEKVPSALCRCKEI